MKRINFIKTLAAETLACIALGNVAALAAPATNAAGTPSRNFSAFGTAKFEE